MHILQLLADDTAASAGLGIGGIIGYLIGYVIGVLPLYGVFGKAGQPGWAAFVPIYNLIVLLKVVGRPVWWIILLLIPIVDIVIVVLLAIDLAKSFAKGTGFAVGLIFLNWIFALILWLGSAQYVGPAAQAPRTA
jgi:hypothetical protein